MSDSTILSIIKRRPSRATSGHASILTPTTWGRFLRRSRARSLRRSLRNCRMILLCSSRSLRPTRKPTLDAWLDFNGVSDVCDAELLEFVPAEFGDEYNDRLRLNSHYEMKFAEQPAIK